VAATQAPTHAPLAQEKTDESSGGLMDSLSNWALPLGGLLGAGVLGGLGFAWMRRRKNKGDGAVDSAAFLESKLEADSFFDASGGQRVDTSAHSSGISSSMVYSPSQLDAAGDVDPVAEAGVYMAYNRDQQAEDILKEAMRITPSRVAIYTTLMEIYAKRGDLKAFDVVAREAHHLTGGHGDEWAKAQEMGRQIEPSNPMYGGAASPSTAAEGEDGTSPDAPFIDRPAVAPTAPMTLEQAQETAKIEANDLDMVFRNSDFKLSESEASEIPVAHLATAPMQIETAGAVNAAADAPTSHMDLAFDLEIPSAPAPVESVDAQFTETALSGITAAAPEALKFDMSDLSLDLTDGGNVAAVPPVAEMASGEASPWLTKLELAREFVALGDSDGARAMAEEVIANAPADVADKARTFIATMV
jgi:pilus assembly protein FimV